MHPNRFLSAGSEDVHNAAPSQDKPLSDAWLAQEQQFITDFFEKRLPESRNMPPGTIICTSKECDDFAKQALRTDDVRLVENQGSRSYTLLCPSQSKIVQFRLKPFDEDVMKLARQIHGTLVPSVTALHDFALPVYVSPVIPGRIHILQSFPPEAFPLERQLNTVVEVARFAAKSAFYPQPASSLSSTSWTATAAETLRKLTQNEEVRKVEPRFKMKAALLLEKLGSLRVLPLVLSHGDFVEINIMVDGHGHVTGVIDFEDAGTEVLGMNLFGVYESFFGHMNQQVWTFFDQPAGDGSGRSVRMVLETAFWDTFWESLPAHMTRSSLEEAMMVALEIGMINRYFVRGLLETLDLESQDHRISLAFARGLLLDR